MERADHTVQPVHACHSEYLCFFGMVGHAKARWSESKDSAMSETSVADVLWLYIVRYFTRLELYVFVVVL